MGYNFKNLCSNILPKNTYKVQIEDIKFKTSSTGVQSFDLQVMYRVLEGPYAKRSIVDTIYEKAASFRLMPFLKACDVDIEREFNSLKELYEYGIKSVKGKVLLLEVGVKTYNGNDYNEVKSFTRLPGSSTSAEDVLAAFGNDLEEATVDVTESTTSVELTPNTASTSKAEKTPETKTEDTAEPTIDFELDDDEDLSF